MWALVLFTVLTTSVLADNDCMKYVQPHYLTECCKLDLPDPAIHINLIKECLSLPNEAPACERDICSITKKGIASADGKLDKSKLKEHTEKFFESSPELSKAVTENCINRDISKIGPPDMCEYTRYRACVGVQLAMMCPEWSNEGECAGSKVAFAECARKLKMEA
ncbi:uncharacterized protein LOC135072979 [Ostrinia nubilalis]|uniref:uncharacterized protein LOC135072979 n=1 Tax=Ostrinia nubilalis TaxID=29057 RepID=UPI0030822FEB